MAPSTPIPIMQSSKLTPLTTTLESPCKMDLDLSDLFIEEPFTAAESTQLDTSLPLSATATLTAVQTADDINYYQPDDDAVEDAVFGCDLPFGVQVDTGVEDTIRSVSHERDLWKAEATQYQKDYENLQQKVCRKAFHDLDLPAEVVRRLERLETEVTRYLTENSNLRDNLKAAKSEVMTLQNHIASQKNKLKGAGKQVRNAKDVASKQEVKANGAMHEKQARVSSERKMKQKCDNALAEVASLTKLCGDLQADLDVERAGGPHMRKGDSASDTAVAVIPVQIAINRAHFHALSETLEISRASVTMSMQEWYDNWKQPKEASKQVVGANYVHDKKSNQVPVNLDKLYADLVEDGHQHTGAEHDGWRSKQSLETICRNAEEQHNSYGTL